MYLFVLCDRPCLPPCCGLCCPSLGWKCEPWFLLWEICLCKCLALGWKCEPWNLWEICLCKCSALGWQCEPWILLEICLCNLPYKKKVMPIKTKGGVPVCGCEIQASNFWAMYLCCVVIKSNLCAALAVGCASSLWVGKRWTLDFLWEICLCKYLAFGLNDFVRDDRCCVQLTYNMMVPIIISVEMGCHCVVAKFKLQNLNHVLVLCDRPCLPPCCGLRCPSLGWKCEPWFLLWEICLCKCLALGWKCEPWILWDVLCNLPYNK